MNPSSPNTRSGDDVLRPRRDRPDRAAPVRASTTLRRRSRRSSRTTRRSATSSRSASRCQSTSHADSRPQLAQRAVLRRHDEEVVALLHGDDARRRRRGRRCRPGVAPVDGRGEGELGPPTPVTPTSTSVVAGGDERSGAARSPPSTSGRDHAERPEVDRARGARTGAGRRRSTRSPSRRLDLGARPRHVVTVDRRRGRRPLATSTSSSRRRPAAGVLATSSWPWSVVEALVGTQCRTSTRRHPPSRDRGPPPPQRRRAPDSVAHDVPRRSTATRSDDAVGQAPPLTSGAGVERPRAGALRRRPAHEVARRPARRVRPRRRSSRGGPPLVGRPRAAARRRRRRRTVDGRRRRRRSRPAPRSRRRPRRPAVARRRWVRPRAAYALRPGEPRPPQGVRVGVPHGRTLRPPVGQRRDRRPAAGQPGTRSVGACASRRGG